MKKKRCTRCSLLKPLIQFHKHNIAEDGRKSRCAVCSRLAEKLRRAEPDHRAVQAWHDLNKRVRTQTEYESVEVRISREEFVVWAAAEFAKWFETNPGITPSVDREDPSGHYSLDNLRVISWGENSRLRRNNHNVHAPSGQAWCGRCKTYRPREDFEKNSSRPHGLQDRCRACRSKSRPRSTNKNWKNNAAPECHSWCGRCKNYLPINKFYKCSRFKSGLQTTCKPCQQKRSKS